jgi:hypothetical protein
LPNTAFRNYVQHVGWCDVAREFVDVWLQDLLGGVRLFFIAARQLSRPSKRSAFLYRLRCDLFPGAEETEASTLIASVFSNLLHEKDPFFLNGPIDWKVGYHFAFETGADDRSAAFRFTESH